MDDGLLDVRVYDGMGSFALAKYFLACSKGSAEPIKGYRGRRVRITTEEPVLTNSDKNITRQARVVEIEIVPGALSMIVGNGIGLTVPVGSAPDAHPLACDISGANGHTETNGRPEKHGRPEKALADAPTEPVGQ